MALREEIAIQQVHEETAKTIQRKREQHKVKTLIRRPSSIVGCGDVACLELTLTRLLRRPFLLIQRCRTVYTALRLHDFSRTQSLINNQEHKCLVIAFIGVMIL